MNITKFSKQSMRSYCDIFSTGFISFPYDCHN